MKGLDPLASCLLPLASCLTSHASPLLRERDSTLTNSDHSIPVDVASMHCNRLDTARASNLKMVRIASKQSATASPPIAPPSTHHNARFGILGVAKMLRVYERSDARFFRSF